MENCKHLQDVGAYHDGQLDAAAAAIVEKHIRECPACAAELAQLGSISQWFAEGADSPSLRLSQMSLHRLYAKATEKTLDLGILRAARWISAVAAAALLASGIWLTQIKPTQASAPTSVARSSMTTPPWVNVAAASYSESSSLETNTPAAAWYLASAQESGR